MSSRAAWRLEGLGFERVCDYVPGKADWFANGLPREGRLAFAPIIGEAARRDVPTCAPAENVGAVWRSSTPRSTPRTWQVSSVSRAAESTMTANGTASMSEPALMFKTPKLGLTSSIFVCANQRKSRRQPERVTNKALPAEGRSAPGQRLNFVVRRLRRSRTA
jgi:hypothetical protein